MQAELNELKRTLNGERAVNSELSEVIVQLSSLLLACLVNFSILCDIVEPQEYRMRASWHVMPYLQSTRRFGSMNFHVYVYEHIYISICTCISFNCYVCRCLLLFAV